MTLNADQKRFYSISNNDSAKTVGFAVDCL